MVASPQTFPSLRSSLESTARHTGWAMLLRGVVAVIFGVIAVRSPNIAAGAFVIVFAFYAFADGILDFVLSAQLGRAGRRWGWYAFVGIASIAVGVIALAYPAVTLLAAVLLVALRAIVLGVLELVGAFSWEGLDNRWLLGLTGALSIVLGMLLLASPAIGALALLWTIGVYAIVFGVMLFALGIRMLSAERHAAQTHGRGPAATVG
ncbi:MAG TPA: DUF308 domain-containing protein [Polyangiaceae bacterium]|nr:DUF308 domain-containing protein [Polyangiaceae bacterium]